MLKSVWEWRDGYGVVRWVETTPTDIRGTVEAMSAGAHGKHPASSARRKRSGESRRAKD